MKPRKIALLLLRFAVAYGVLVAPWPGVRQAYATLFRAAGPILLSPFWPRATLRFVPYEPRGPAERGLDTYVSLRRAGSSNEIYAKIDSRRAAYLPLAFLAALAVATPATRFRWIRASVVALLLVHVFVAARIAALLATSIADVSGLERTVLQPLSHHLWTSGFVVALGVWAIAFVRPRDLDLLLRSREGSLRLHRVTAEKPVDRSG